MLSTKLTY